MKKYLMYLILICVLTLTCGGEKYTRLNVFFGEQPQGGLDVTEIRCYVVGRLEGGDTPLQATLQGWAAHEIGQDEELYGYDTWTFTHSDIYEELPIILQAPQGNVWVGYFWFICFWTDEDGTHNTIYSDTAHCYH